VHSGEPYFDGTIFHRVIPDFMIQGGSPRGIANPGAGGPGFTIEDEFNADLLHTQPGRLSMANVGRPNTGSSQFFVTVAETPWLDFTHPRNRANGTGHAVFAQVIRNYDVVEAISKVARDGRDKPLTDVVLEKVSIVRVEGDVPPPATAAAPPE
jgi:peptidyl-prolyl cis-trans isomerase A (cyclophilin A)